MNRWWKYGKYHWNFIKVSSSISDIACEQALHLGDIVKSRRARSTREEMLKPEAGKRKESVQRSLINFHFHPGNPGTLQSVKTVTAVGRRLEKKQPPVKIRQPRARRICFFYESLLQQLSTHQSNVFVHWYFFIQGTTNFNVFARIRTRYFDSYFVYIEKSSTAPRCNHQHRYICPFRNWRTTFSWTRFLTF